MQLIGGPLKLFLATLLLAINLSSTVFGDPVQSSTGLVDRKNFSQWTVYTLSEADDCNCRIQSEVIMEGTLASIRICPEKSLGSGIYADFYMSGEYLEPKEFVFNEFQFKILVGTNLIKARMDPIYQGFGFYLSADDLVLLAESSSFIVFDSKKSGELSTNGLREALEHCQIL